MNKRPCDALKEVQLGHLGIDNFAPPNVFDSDVFANYGVTVADLRRHLLDCAGCSNTMAEARVQLRHFDESRFHKISSLLQWLEKNWLDRSLKRAEHQAEEEARDFADGALADEDEEYREALVDLESEERLAGLTETVYWTAVRLQVFMAGPILRWLETFLPPAFPRVSMIGPGRRVVDVLPEIGSIKRVIDLAAELKQLLADANQNACSVLLRALLLHEVFRGNLAPVLLFDNFQQFSEQFAAFIEKAASAPDHGVSWEKFWKHYSRLAELEANDLSRSHVAKNPEFSQAQPEDFVLMLKRLGSVDSKVEQVSDQLHRLEEQGRAHQASLDEMRQRHDAAINQIEKIVAHMSSTDRSTSEQALRAELPGVYERLDPQARSLLLAAEQVHRTPNLAAPSLLVQALATAFEVQVRSSVASPLLAYLKQQKTPKLYPPEDWTSVDRNKPVYSPGLKVERLTLGEIACLLNHDYHAIAECFVETLRINLDDIRWAVTEVNGPRKDAAHGRSIDPGTAEGIRDKWLHWGGRPGGIFAVLFRSE